MSWCSKSIAYDLWQQRDKALDFFELTKEHKRALLQVLTAPTDMQGERSPLFVALSQTTASMVRCFEGEAKELIYPHFIAPEPIEPKDEEWTNNVKTFAETLADTVLCGLRSRTAH